MFLLRGEKKLHVEHLLPWEFSWKWGQDQTLLLHYSVAPPSGFLSTNIEKKQSVIQVKVPQSQDFSDIKNHNFRQILASQIY